METFRDLSPLLNPKAIAVVGASERQGSAGRLVLENLRHLEYEGAAYAVHPKHKEVCGFPCYPDPKSFASRPNLTGEGNYRRRGEPFRRSKDDACWQPTVSPV